MLRAAGNPQAERCNFFHYTSLDYSWNAEPSMKEGICPASFLDSSKGKLWVITHLNASSLVM